MGTQIETLILALDARKMKDGAREATKATDDVGRASREAEKQVKRLDTSAAKLGTTTSKTGVSLRGLAAGFSAVAAAQAAIRTIATYEETLITLQGVSRATADEQERFAQTARELGASTRFSATEAAEGLLFLSRAGFTANEAIAAVPATLDLATAGQLQLGEAADIASNVLSQFNLAATETGRAGDVLVSVSNRANTNVRQLAEGLKFVGPLAGSLKIPLEETAAALGVLGDSGVQASLAGTNLRGVISNLLGPTGEAKSALDELGISLDEVDPSKRGLIEIFRQFGEANLSASAAVDIFGRRNASAALILAGNAEQIGNLRNETVEAGNESARIARTLEGTLAGSFRTLKSTVDEAILSTGDRGFGGALKSATEVATETVRVLFDIGNASGNASNSAKILAEVVEFLIIRFGALQALQVSALLFEVGKAAFAATRGITALSAAVAKNPLGLLATGAAAAIAFFVDFGDEAEEAADSVDRLSASAQALQDLTKAQSNATKLFGSDQDSPAALRARAKALEEVAIQIKSIRDQAGSDFGLLTSKLVDQILPGQDSSKNPLFFSEILRGIEDQIRANNEEAQSLRVVATAREEAARSEVRAAAQRVDSRKSLDELKESLRQQRVELYLSNEEIERNRILSQARRKSAGLANDEAEREIDLIRSLTENLIQQRKVRDEIERQREADQRAAEARAAGVQAIEEQIRRLREEVSILQLDTREREIATEVLIAENTAREAGADLTRRQREEIRRLAQERQRLREEDAPTTSSGSGGIGLPSDEAARSAVLDLIGNLRFEEQQLGRTNEERERAIALRQFEAKAIGLSADEAAVLEKVFLNQFDAFQRAAAGVRVAADAQDQLRDRLERLRNLGEDVGDSLGNAFTDFITGASNAREALASLIADLSAIGLSEFVTGPLRTEFGDLLQGLFSARGNVFNDGNLIPFASGGIISRRSEFPLRGGLRGVAGEAGPEAIVPLKRDQAGDLGVKIAGGGGGGQVFNFYISGVQNGDGLRRSARQITDDITRALRRSR